MRATVTARSDTLDAVLATWQLGDRSRYRVPEDRWPTDEAACCSACATPQANAGARSGARESVPDAAGGGGHGPRAATRPEGLHGRFGSQRMPPAGVTEGRAAESDGMRAAAWTAARRTTPPRDLGLTPRFTRTPSPPVPVVDLLSKINEEDPCGAAIVAPQTALNGPCASDIQEDVDKHEADCPAPTLECRGCDLPNPVPYSEDLKLKEDVDLNNIFTSSDNEETVAEPAEFDLVQYAWWLLQENVDLVEWVTCLVEGPADARCMSDKLFNKQTIKFDGFPPPARADSVMWTDTVTNVIRINTTNPQWQSLVGNSTSPDGDLAMCSVIVAASILMHEMVHTCQSLFVSEETRECRAQAAGNALVWALLQRYPCAGDNNLCTPLAEPCSWMNSAALGADFSPEGCS
jgi:hypothetical protein